MHTEFTDQELIERFLEGNDQALESLVERYLNNVYNFAYSLLRDHQGAEDVTQESFVKAWKNIHRFIKGNNFRSWIFTIAYNTAIDLLRQKKELALSQFENDQGYNFLVDQIADLTPRADQLLEQAQDLEYLKSLLAGLNPEYREILTLRYKNNLKFKEIALLLGQPLNTVKSQYRRALAALGRIS